MSNFVFLDTITLGPCINTPGELTQLVTLAQPTATVGFVIYSATAPDVVTYPSLKRCVWVDTSVSPPVERHWEEATLSWIQDLPEDGSIVNDMIADYTIQLVKLSPTGGTPGYVLRLNPGGTQVIYDDPQNLFSYASPLPITKIGRPAAGTWILSSDGTTNSWSTVNSIVQTSTILLSQLDTSSAASPEVLSYLGTTVAFRAVNDVTADGSLAITKLAPGPANYLLGTNSGGTARTDLSPAQVYDLIKAYITAAIGGYVTADVDLDAIPAAGAAASFAHGLASTPKRYGGFLKCTDAGGDGSYSENDIIIWTCVYNTGGDEIRNASTCADSTNVILGFPEGDLTAGSLYVLSKTGATRNETLTASKWACGAWAYAN